MPNVTIYIRNEDWSKWTEIEDKPTWLSAQLNDKAMPGNSLLPSGGAGNLRPQEEVKPVKEPLPWDDPGIKFCKHGAVKGFCKKGCK